MFRYTRLIDNVFTITIQSIKNERPPAIRFPADVDPMDIICIENSYMNLQRNQGTDALPTEEELAEQLNIYLAHEALIALNQFCDAGGMQINEF